MNKIVTLKKNEDRRINNGHLWAFSNEIQGVAGEPAAGDIVEPFYLKMKWLKMKWLTATLRRQQTGAAKLDTAIAANLKELGDGS